MAVTQISSYAGSVVSGDWRPAVKAAFDAIVGTGGTINIDTDITVKSSPAILGPPTFAPTVIRFASDCDKFITVDGTNSVFPFLTGNMLRAIYDKLVFVGSGVDDDAGIVIGGSYTDNILVERCEFGGLRGDKVISIGDGFTICKIDHCKFGGTSNSEACAYASGTFGQLSVKNSEFIDYLNFRATNYSKTPNGQGAWIKAVGGGRNGGNSYVQLLEVENCVGDEGAGYQVYGKDLPRVSIRQMSGNVNGGGVGIYLENVRSAIIEECWFGYTNNDCPAVQLVNCGDVEINGLTVNQGVKRVVVDAATRLKIRNSPGVIIQRV